MYRRTPKKILGLIFSSPEVVVENVESVVVRILKTVFIVYFCYLTKTASLLRDTKKILKAK